MKEDTPLKDFQTNVGSFLLRLNLLSGDKNDISQYNEGLSVYAANREQKYFFQEFYNIENIPQSALTIFFDLQTLFEYIVQNVEDPNKFKITSEGIIVCNIIRARNTERRQEVILQMSRKPLPQLFEEKKMIQNSIVEKDLAQIKLQKEKLTELCLSLRLQVQKLVTTNELNVKRFQEIEQKASKDNILLKKQLQENKNRLSAIEIQMMSSKEVMMNVLSQNRILVQTINQLKREISNEKQKKQQIREEMKQVRKQFRLIKKDSSNSSTNIKDILGQKIDLTIDKKNQFLNKYKLEDDTIEKIDGDQTRFQILGNQLLCKTSKSYFEVKVINLVNNGLLIGIVDQSRKGQRHSYDQKECICYDGTGKIFDMGRKSPTPVKFMSGHVVRVVVDCEQSLIKWFLNYTEIGSCLIPNSLRNCQLVPYIELNEIKDKISLNK